MLFAFSVKPNLQVFRAKFSEITPASIRRACETLIEPDANISDAVDVRQELDLRIGKGTEKKKKRGAFAAFRGCLWRQSHWRHFLQVHPSPDSRRSACRRFSQNPWPTSSSHMAAVNFPLWALWWNASKPSKLLYQRPSTKSKVTKIKINVSKHKPAGLCSVPPVLHVSPCGSATHTRGRHRGVQLETKPAL